MSLFKFKLLTICRATSSLILLINRFLLLNQGWQRSLRWFLHLLKLFLWLKSFQSISLIKNANNQLLNRWFRLLRCCLQELRYRHYIVRAGLGLQRVQMECLRVLLFRGWRLLNVLKHFQLWGAWRDQDWFDDGLRFLFVVLLCWLLRHHLFLLGWWFLTWSLLLLLLFKSLFGGLWFFL